MNTIKCMIIDDEPPAITLLEKYAGMIPKIEVVSTCQSALEAYQQLQEQTVDLLFLDIRMPVLNGLDFIKSLQHPPAVILTTAYREYALDGYDLDIIDYLLKPITFDRFLKGVDRFIERSHQKEKVSPSTQPDEKADFIYFNVNKTHHKVKFADIIYLESLKDYVSIYLSNNRLVVKGNLGPIMIALTLSP